MSFYSDVFWGLDWMVLSLVVVFYLFPFLLSSHLSKMGVLKYYFSSFWWWCAVKQILNIFFVFPIVGLFNSAKSWKLCLMNWVKHKNMKKLPIFCSKGKVVFDQSNQSKIVLWRLYHVVFDISASKHKISKAFLCKDIWCISWFITGSLFKREMFGMGPEKLMGFVNKYISYCIFCNLLQIWNQNSDWSI